jgi:hypothetical protein
MLLSHDPTDTDLQALFWATFVSNQFVPDHSSSALTGFSTPVITAAFLIIS